MDFGTLGFFEILVISFVPTALAATQLRAKGALGLLSIAVIFGVCIAAVALLEGPKMFFGFVGALAGMAAGGAVSDWRECERNKRMKDAERRDHDARFK